METQKVRAKKVSVISFHVTVWHELPTLDITIIFNTLQIFSDIDLVKENEEHFLTNISGNWIQICWLPGICF